MGSALLRLLPCEHVSCLGGAPAFNAGAALSFSRAWRGAAAAHRAKARAHAESEGPRFLRLARCWLASTNSRHAGSADG
jgi:hypothetical protein